jgi:hypothetical protein
VLGAAPLGDDEPVTVAARVQAPQDVTVRLVSHVQVAHREKLPVAVHRGHRTTRPNGRRRG